jgi:hypothetical protein
MPKPKRPKKQVTVRIDGMLLETALKRCAEQGITLTDAVEEGLWAHLLRDEPSEVQAGGRQIFKYLPLDLQRQTIRFWAYLMNEAHPAYQREFMEKELAYFVPESDGEMIRELLARFKKGD